MPKLAYINTQLFTSLQMGQRFLGFKAVSAMINTGETGLRSDIQMTSYYITESPLFYIFEWFFLF